MLKNRFGLGLMALAAVGFAFAATGCDMEGRSYMSIGTAGTGGIYYPLGGTIASRLSAMDEEGRQFTAEVTGGALGNVRLLQRGEMDIAMSLGSTAYQAYHGVDEGTQPFTDLRVLAPLYPNVVNILVPRGSTAGSVEDFEGLRVSVGAAGAGTEPVSRMVLDAYGLGYDDIRVRYLTFSESAGALRDGSVDAAIISVGYPAAAVMEVMETGDGRLLPITSPWMERLTSEHSYFFRSVIPAGAYRGVEEDIHTIAEWNWLLAREDLPDDVVRNILQIVTEERDRLIRVTPIANQIDMEALRSAPIPLHPVTQAWVDEHLP
ncbi:MAG: TAXI family TRAP transporter solute-binding subunit [Gemmatimonadales bacterium]|nr:MAG: TAXI family TRAP transporter solute-binding subunit [Gemmatimonadales bacterium]